LRSHFVKRATLPVPVNASFEAELLWHIKWLAPGAAVYMTFWPQGTLLLGSSKGGDGYIDLDTLMESSSQPVYEEYAREKWQSRRIHNWITPIITDFKLCVVVVFYETGCHFRPLFRIVMENYESIPFLVILLEWINNISIGC
jgi:hypothetical protein